MGKNRGRAVVLLAILTILVVQYSTQALVAGVVALMGLLPVLAVQLSFAVVFIGAQFFMMFYFLSRPRKYTVTPDDEQFGNVSFESYRGQPDLLDHARSTVRILQGVREFEIRGGEMPKGLLLSGGPGTGKTFLASVIAAEARLPFIYLDASSLQGAFVGTSQLMVMKLFRDARGLGRKYAKPGQRGACIMFLDELDAIGMARGGQGGGIGIGMGAGGMMAGGGAQGLNALLNQMDSLTEHVEDRLRFKILRWLGVIRGPVKNRPLVFVIGATNRPEVLDSALVRPGRLDRIIEVHAPDADGRRDIIGYYLNKKRYDKDIDVELMVTDSMGWSPIMIKTVINEALIVAHDDGREELTYKDWLTAGDERSIGIKQPIRSWHREDRRKTAYHEAAHAVVSRYANPEVRISKATIIRRGHALGFVQQQPKEERTSLHARTIEARIMVSLAGHVIESRYLKGLTTGPSSDLQAATAQAMAYVSVWAMGPTKIVMPGGPAAAANGPFLVAAHELLDQLYAETERLILQKMTAVHYIARALIERDELIGTELEEVFAEAEAADPTLSRSFERKIVQFRQFAPKPQPPQLNEWEPAAAAAASTPAAANEPELVPGADVGWGEGGAGVGGVGAPGQAGGAGESAPGQAGGAGESWHGAWPEPPEDWVFDPSATWSPEPTPEG
jgi:cell division protease FtsH